MPFAENLGKNISKNISKTLIGKFSLGMLAMHQKPFDHAKQSVTDVFKTASKRAIQKTAEATGDFIDNKIARKIAKVSKHSQHNNSETATSNNDKEMPKNWYISPEKRQEIIDELRLN